MNIITRGLLAGFVKNEELQNSSESDNFEHFCNYTVIANQCNQTFNFDDIATGGEGDTGIDGIGIIINGTLMNNLAGNEIATDDFLRGNNDLEIDFIFVQAKTSSRFNGSDILRFFHGVEEFFNESSILPRNNKITDFSELKDKIFSQVGLGKNKPNIKVFYVTTGTKPDDNNMNSIINRHAENLNNLKIFNEPKVCLLGADEIADLYRKTISKNSAEFIFNNKIELSPIEGVIEAYYGVIPFKEFKKILIDEADENANLLRIFDDNIRDYQGDSNTVNDKIFDTLKSDNPDLFSVLNNGVTVIAYDGDFFRKNVTITDYQIVNGCQTSNVLFKNRHNEALDDVQIPLRLIITQDSEVKHNIILSTNTQTPTRKSQHSAMSDFQKGLELYYNGCLQESGLYYERRSKQYNFKLNIPKIKIITIDNQTKSYSAMFRRDAHLATTYFGKLANEMNDPGTGLCDDEHKYAPYYMAGLAYYKLETLFRHKKIDEKFKKVRFYILMLVLMIITGKYKPKLDMTNERQTEKFCRPIIDKLLDDKTCLRIFQKAVEIIVRSGEVIDSFGEEIDIKQKLKSIPMTATIIDTFNEDTDRI